LEGSDAWESFAEAVQGSAKPFGESTALEEGEDHGLNDYKRDYCEITQSAKQFVWDKLLPEQERSHRTLALLRTITN
jgi:hypothetical protein